jgi:hypothetical protein
MSGAAALGRGESLTNIALAAARGAIPGGTLIQAAFDIGVGLAKGERLDQAALHAARNQLANAVGPAAAEAALAALDTGMALANGENLGTVALNLAKDQIAKQASNVVLPAVSAAFDTFASTSGAVKLIGDLTAGVPDAVNAVAQLTATASFGNTKATATLEQLATVAKVVDRVTPPARPEASAQAALENSIAASRSALATAQGAGVAAESRRRLDAERDAEAAAEARRVAERDATTAALITQGKVETVPANLKLVPPLGSTAMTVAAPVAAAKGIFGKVREKAHALGVAHETAYQQGTVVVRTARSRTANVKRLGGILKTGI